MPDKLIQKNRLLKIESPLGENKFILTAFSGTESVSKLFEFSLDLFSEDSNISEKNIIGKPLSVCIQGDEGPIRYFHGIVNRFYLGPLSLRQGRSYRAQIVPWFWFLNLSKDCRIFQNLAVKKIIQQVFQESGMSDFSMSKVSGGNTVRNYCTQYHESHFNFICRLLEEEGIYYYFKHEKDKHTLILADSPGGFTKSNLRTVYRNGEYPSSHIRGWEHVFQYAVGKRTQSSYDFERPRADLQKSASTILDFYQMNKYEHYEYKGAYNAALENEPQTKLLMEANEVPCELIEGAGNYALFSAGGQFALEKSEIGPEQCNYTLLSVTHQAVDPSSGFNTSTPATYSNQFLCIPAKVAFKPPRTTPKPCMMGLQTAVVVGPDNEEIYCDKYGRIKVKFHWDRNTKQKKGENSCWIRVAQVWSGKQWGTIFTPRIGQEVIVSFLEGDPDQPLIIGSVYNAELLPPYTLPAQASQSGIRTKSTKQGGQENSNELKFEDKKGEELISMQAEKDLKTLVKNDEQREIKNNQEIKIKKDRTIIVEEGNESITIKKGNEVIVIETGNETRTLKMGNRVVKLNAGNDQLEIQQGNQVTKVSMGKSSLEAMQSIEFTVGGNSIKLDQTGITIKGIKLTLNGTIVQVSANASLKLEGAIVQMDGSGLLKLQGALTMVN